MTAVTDFLHDTVASPVHTLDGGRLMPLRQTTGFVQSLLRLVGLDWATPDFSTLCRRQQTLNASLPYRGSTGPLNLLIDSTGIKAEGEGEWNARRLQAPCLA